MTVVDLPGAAHLMLVDGVSYLDPAAAVFQAMLDGWARQQRTRFLKTGTIAPRVRLVRRMFEFTNEYPWQWSCADVEAFFDHLRSGPAPPAVSTARGYQVTLRMFLEFVTDVRYGWQPVCLQRFGQAPAQLLHEWNTIVHATEFEGQPTRRPLSYDEVQLLFDAADQRVADTAASKRKGAVSAARDAAVLKTVYAFGLRRREVCGLDLADLRHNPSVPQFGRFGALFVRWGKGSTGSPPKRRTVLTLPEMDWITEVLDHYLAEIRPQLANKHHPAMWVSERCARMSLRRLDFAFETVRVLAGLPEELDLHGLRHSYITHCTEFGYPAKFVQDQAGHVYASTTALYTHVSDEFRNQLLRNKLRQHDTLWEPMP